MDETKSGERPDTLVLTGLPIRWFASASHNRPRFSVSSDDTSSSYLSFLVDEEKPNPLIVKEAFEVFGKVREIDIPMLDPSQNPDCLEDYMNSSDTSNNSYDLALKAESTLRNDSGCTEEYVGGFGKIGPDTIGVLNPAIQHCAINSSTDSGNQPKSYHLSKSKKSNILTSSPTNVGSPLTFIAYVQYMDYTGFSRAMDMLRGQKLVYAPTYRSQSSLLDQNEKLYYAAEIKIDFDRSKHLSPDSIHSRQIKRNQLLIVAERRRAEARTIAEAERERLRLLEDSERKAIERREAEALAAEAERTARRAAREESKRQIAIDRCKRIKEDLLKKKISLEDYRRIVAIRKVEGIRLMTFLLAKIQARHDLIVATRRLARISKAEKALADAEATVNVVLSSTSQSNILTQTEANDQLETGEKDDSNKICSQSGLPSVNSSPESSPIEETKEQDSRFHQLLAKREEFLRNNLLRKRADVLRTQIYERSIMYNSSHSAFPEHRKRIQLTREKYS
ncbi:A-kinase anchor protein [Schistosoma japonicum]|uniref:A-kinase anchor protein n=1 Tax=Schistosoma japonicum TaxID=6182 RepID=A0A4Z2D740_SCHJA|nr:A-kinase anchor protein [Schistosoma japonicum]